MHALYQYRGEIAAEALDRTAPQGHRKAYNDLAGQVYKFDPLPALSPEEREALRRWVFFGRDSDRGGPLPNCIQA